MWLSNLKQGLKKGFLNRDKGFIRRWPVDPKIVFYGPPNVFKEEITQRYTLHQILHLLILTKIYFDLFTLNITDCLNIDYRFAIDMGVPVVSMDLLL